MNLITGLKGYGHFSEFENVFFFKVMGLKGQGIEK